MPSLAQELTLGRFWEHKHLTVRESVTKLVQKFSPLEEGEEEKNTIRKKKKYLASIAGCTADMLKRRLAALDLKDRSNAERQDILATDVGLWVAISPYAALTMGPLALAAVSIGVPAPPSHPEQLHHQPAPLKLLQNMDKQVLLPLVIRHVLSGSDTQSKDRSPSLDEGTEEWRQRLFDLVVFSSDDSLTRTLSSSAQISHEIRFLLQWCKQDSILVNPDRAELFLEHRDTWLSGITERLKELEDGGFLKDDFAAAKASVGVMRHVVECEAGSALFCAPLYEHLRRHVTGTAC